MVATMATPQKEKKKTMALRYGGKELLLARIGVSCPLIWHHVDPLNHNWNM
jgi:hypothetical protein